MRAIDRLWTIMQERRSYGFTAAFRGFDSKPHPSAPCQPKNTKPTPTTRNLETLLCLYPIEKFFPLLQILPFVTKL